METTFSYDTMGRLTSVAPTGSAALTYTYTEANGSTPASVSIARGPATSQGQRSIVEFDSLGRISREGILMPDGLWSYQYTELNAAGRVRRVTELGRAIASSLPGTTYDYDTFDRVIKITPPAGSSSAVDYEYEGNWIKRRKSSIALSTGVETITATEEYDALGRLIRVKEKSGPTTSTAPKGVDVETKYAYDPAGRLRFVTMKGAETTQTRVFDYDGRGFLRWEMHPESGMTSYLYDSRGNVLSRAISEAKSPYDLKYSYDAAGRLLKIEGRNPRFDPEQTGEFFAEFRPVKEFVFAAANEPAVTDPPEDARPADLGMGKLRTAIRYNYPLPVDTQPGGVAADVIKTVEHYFYRDTAGRKTDRSLEIWKQDSWVMPWMLRRTISQYVDYNDLDQPSHIRYPLCVGCALPPDAPVRDLAPVYSYGRTTEVPQYASDFRYAANGMRTRLTHQNGMIDEVELDSTGMPRPKRVWSTPSPVVCTAPFIITPARAVTNGNVSTLSVVAGGTAPLSYQWYKVGSGILEAIPGATDSSYVPSPRPTTTTKYQVDVSNACNTVTSTTVLSIDTCSPPTLAPMRTQNRDGTIRLQARPVGTGVITCVWRRANDSFVIGTGDDITVSAAEGTNGLIVAATDDCSQTATATLEPVATVSPLIPGLVATANSALTSITVTLPQLAPGTVYSVQKRHHGTAEVLTSQTPTIVDSNVVAGATYAYVLLCTEGPCSNVDVASTVPFTSAEAMDKVKASHMEELLTAVNAVRKAVGWPALTWKSIMPASVDVPELGKLISAWHVMALRPRMEEALSALGMPLAAYTDPDLKSMRIKKTYMLELQARVK